LLEQAWQIASQARVGAVFAEEVLA
jgi:hypothetical protein